MKTKQEQTKQMLKILCDKCQCSAIYTSYMAESCRQCEDIVEALHEAGYGDISEYKAENERLTKILNSLTFSEKETNIFGKPVLLMFAGVKVEEAIKRVAEYDGLNAEIERLKAVLEIEKKQAQIDVLNKAKDRLIQGRVANDNVVINANCEIGRLIKEVQEE